jgi:hypothetical protein
MGTERLDDQLWWANADSDNHRYGYGHPYGYSYGYGNTAAYTVARAMHHGVGGKLR